MKLLKYLEFITEEAGIKGLFKLSREVKHKLEKIIDQFNDPIAESILDLDRSQQDITYINITDKKDKVSYLDVSRANYFFEKWKGEKVSVNDFIRIYNLCHVCFFYKLVVLLLVLEKLFLICVVYSIHVALSLGSAGGFEPAAADMLPSLPSTCKEGG